ncbi:MAG TPA: response regulator [Chroococcales cyanobacterium]|jgi:CheY-like chemotaxis protein
MSKQDPSILIADPSRFHCNLLSIFCGEFNIRSIFQAQGPSDAIEKVINHSPTVILTETEFPHMSGGELVRIFKRLCPAATILVCTNAEEAVPEMMKSGAVGHIPKPMAFPQRKGFQKALADFGCDCRKGDEG